MEPLLAWLNANHNTVIAFATLAGVAVATAYSIFAGLQWRATKRQADITQRTFEVSHRPYVTVTPQWGTATVNIDELSFECVFENHGTLPAVVTVWRLHVRLPDRDVGSEELSESDMRLCLLPGRTYTRRLHFEGDGIWPTPRVHVEAVVEYRGATDRVYQTRVASQIADGRFEDPRQELE